MTSSKQWKIKELDSKSSSFCGAKWYNASMYFFAGTTSSCHHNPWHAIDTEEIKLNPAALHNTSNKKSERKMMQDGLKPVGCQFCWVMEDTVPDSTSDRVTSSRLSSSDRLQAAFDGDPNADYDLDYLEIAFDRTCQLGCSYCSPVISSTWATDIRTNGKYRLLTDTSYTSTNDDSMIKFGKENPYADAFFKWWEQGLYKNLQILRITGGEPMMSGYTWKLLDWLADNPTKSTCTIHITTNLAYSDEILQKFLSKCSKIMQPIEVWTSAETVGAKDEYIRDGLEWNQWATNLDTVLAHPSISKVGICCTMGVLQADGYAEFLEWFTEKYRGLPRDKFVHSVNILRFPSFQNIITMPDHLRVELSNEISATVARLKLSTIPMSSYQMNQITRVISYITDIAKPHKTHKTNSKQPLGTTFEEVTIEFNRDDLEKDFKSFFTEFDKRRGKNLAQTFPRLADWYNAI